MKVALFVTCLVDNFFPKAGESMVRILHEYGVDVEFPLEQTCCGQPAFNSGYTEEARSVAMTMLRAFKSADYVVSPSGSCTGMIHHYYPNLFQDDPALAAQATELSNKTYEFSQFLVNVLGVTALDGAFPHRVTYHPSCHGSRLLGVRREPEQLLGSIRDIQLVPLPYANDCCGFGGTFAVKMGDISSAMVKEKAEHVLETEADVLVSTDMGCLMNIGGRLLHDGRSVRVMHLAELLYQAMTMAQSTKEVRTHDHKR